jgi:hypothetical protein
MRFLRILIVTAALCSFFPCLYPAAKTLSKTDQTEQERTQKELRDKMPPEDKFTEDDVQRLKASLPNDVKLLVAVYAIEPWEDYSGILAGKEDFLGPHWDPSEQLLPLAIRKSDTIFTWIPKDKDDKSRFVVYNGFRSSCFPYPPKSVFDISAATVDGTGRSLITGDDQGIVWFWDVESSTLLGKMRISNNKITDLAVSSNNKYLLVSDDEPRIFWFEIKKLYECKKKEYIEMMELNGDLCAGIKSLLLSTIYDAIICQGAGIACDARNCIVLVEDCQKTEDQGVIWVHWYKYNQSTKELDCVQRCRLMHKGTVRSVVLNHEATRLAVVSDTKTEMKKHEFPFYYSQVTLWDLVRQKRLIRWMCRKSMLEEPVRQVAIMGHNALALQEAPQVITVVHAPEEDSYKKRTTQFKQGYDLWVDVSSVRIDDPSSPLD